jgi:hypothetical protein
MRKKQITLALNNEVHYNGHDNVKTSLSGYIVNETVIYHSLLGRGVYYYKKPVIDFSVMKGNEYLSYIKLPDYNACQNI